MGLLLRTPRVEGSPFALACFCWCVWQPLQTDHADGPCSSMQVAEKKMAKWMGIPVFHFKFKAAEVSEIKRNGELVGEKRDETAFKQRLEKFLCDNELC